MRKVLRHLWDVITTQPGFPIRPTIYFMWWGQALRLLLTTDGTLGPLAVETRFGHPINELWLGLSLTAPLLALLAWCLITHFSGRLEYVGIRIRMFADVGLLTAVLTYHLGVVLTNPVTSNRIPARYLVGAVLLIVIALVLADFREVSRIERRARHARQVRVDG